MGALLSTNSLNPTRFVRFPSRRCSRALTTDTAGLRGRMSIPTPSGSETNTCSPYTGRPESRYTRGLWRWCNSRPIPCCHCPCSREKGARIPRELDGPFLVDDLRVRCGSKQVLRVDPVLHDIVVPVVRRQPQELLDS